MICFMNGHYIAQEELKISPFDHGFLYGLGFFETFRTYDGKALFLHAHLQRLQKALDTYRIAFPYTEKMLEEIIAQLVKLNGGKDGYFRLNVSAGQHEIGLAPTAYEEPNVIVFQKALPTVKEDATKAITILKTARNTPEVGMDRFKGHHYGNNVFARFELPSLAQQEGVFLTEEGFIAEGITSNIFWVRDQVLYTPTLQTGILGGITRQTVISLAKAAGIDVHEGKYDVSHLQNADEIFLTNAIAQIQPVHKFERYDKLGLNGPITALLQKAFTAHIQDELQGRV